MINHKRYVGSKKYVRVICVSFHVLKLGNTGQYLINIEKLINNHYICLCLSENKT
jgi:hypothetical protein